MRLFLVIALAGVTVPAFGQGTSLQEQLMREGTESLVAAARRDGDPQRGAILFHQPFLACRKCHAVGDLKDSILPGPDLARVQPRLTDTELVEAILDPSRKIRTGFETIVLQLRDGTSVSGILARETAEAVVIRDGARPGELVTVPTAQIEERGRGTASLMPSGQVNALAGRPQFLDLVRYLMELAEGGVARARELQPPAALFAWEPPAYEKTIDHAGMIRDLDQKAFQRGEAIYQRLCVNCHGTREQPGSLPTALRFAEGTFKNGADPYRMYQTLTLGYGFMMPQTWMVPQQKYDVIHYIREAYLKPHNPRQHVPVPADYLAGLPAGTSRGPAPSLVDPWSAMNYGSSLISTYEVGNDGRNFAYKGIAVRVDPGPGGIARGRHWQVFDHDTLRVAAAWSRKDEGTAPGFIDWQGIHFDGRHQAHPHLAGSVVVANPTGPGWANPETGGFEDPRILGRDQRRYGPLPRSWGQLNGVYHHGDQVIVSYRVGATSILEMPGAVPPGALSAPEAPVEEAVFTRAFQVGPRLQMLRLKVATPTAEATLQPLLQDAADLAVQLVPEDSPRGPVQQFHGTCYYDMADGAGLDWSQDYSIRARLRTEAGGTILCQTPRTGPWQPDGKSLFVRGGRLTFDIGWVGAVTGRTRVADGKWHDVAATWTQSTGILRLYVDGKPDGEGKLQPRGPATGQVVRLGYTSPNFPDPTAFQGQLADVRFYQHVLSPEQIRKSGEPNEQPRAHWTPTELEPQLRDLSGHNHHGTLQGSLGGPRHRWISAGVSPRLKGAAWSRDTDGALVLDLPAGDEPLRFVVSVTSQETPALAPAVRSALVTQPALDLLALTQGGPRRWPEELPAQRKIGDEAGPFAVDELSLPASNPWLAQLRPTGLDFFSDARRMAVCTWDGDVWIVGDLDGTGPLHWRRVASGLFQPLGLKILRDQIHVTCRDQLARLHDTNGDGEIDFVECVNNDHQVTEHFHEFAMGLQTDAEGNFYYAKSARHALPAVVPHHGTLLKVLPDGSRTEILATGFRAANGVCLNPDGSFIVTDQEGHWNPKNRINWVRRPEPGRPPRFYGNLFGYHEVTDPADDVMEPPLCWITNAFDRSPAELLWVTSDRWGPLKGSLLNLSYGHGKVYVVPFEQVAAADGSGDVRVQGGMCELPLPMFPTGIMRGRFHPVDGHLYACGMFAWAGNVTQPGGLYRIRATGKPVHVPVGLSAHSGGVTLRFSGDLDPATADDPAHYRVRTWSLKRSANYGSRHYDEQDLDVTGAELAADRRSVRLTLPQIRPTWCMSISFQLKGSGGEAVEGVIHNTIHGLAESPR